MKYTKTDSYEIMSDGRMVWVNSNRGGYSLGRFGYGGIDVHRDFFDQTEDMSECLDCKAGPTTRQDWERFKTGMLRFHNVVVPDKHMPRFLTNGDSSAGFRVSKRSGGNFHRRK